MYIDEKHPYNSLKTSDRSVITQIMFPLMSLRFGLDLGMKNTFSVRENKNEKE